MASLGVSGPRFRQRQDRILRPGKPIMLGMFPASGGNSVNPVLPRFRVVKQGRRHNSTGSDSIGFPCNPRYVNFCSRQMLRGSVCRLFRHRLRIRSSVRLPISFGKVETLFPLIRNSSS